MAELKNNTNSDPPPGEGKNHENAVERTGLSFKQTVSISLLWMKRKPVKFVLSLFLAVFAFTLFGFSLTVSMMDITKAEIKKLYDNGLKTLIIRSENERHYYVRLTKHIDGYRLTERQLKDLSEINPAVSPMKATYNFLDVQSSLFLPDEYILPENENLYESKFSSFQYLVELNPFSGESDARLIPDKRFLDSSLSRLPSNFDEIAITDAHMDIFMRFGYRDESGEKIEIHTPDDLIGKKIDGLSVSGVYSTERDKSIYEKYDNALSEIEGDEYALLTMFDYGPPSSAYVCEGFIAHRKRECRLAVVNLSGDVNHDARQIRKLFYVEDNIVCKVSLCSAYSGYYYRVSLISDYSPLLCVPAGLIFSFLSLISFFIFFMAIKKMKKRDIKMTSGFETTKWEDFKIRLCFMGITMLTVFLLATLFTGIACAAFNSADYYLNAFGLNFPALLLLLVLCFVFGFLNVFLTDCKGLIHEIRKHIQGEKSIGV